METLSPIMNKRNSLTEMQLAVLVEKGTEKPFSGEFDDFGEKGTYLCRQCGLALFRSNTKFHSGCGWPSFDEEIQGAVRRLMDADRQRTEIVCSRCNGHLGHVFTGEGFTTKSTRHCINSISLDFVSDEAVLDTEEAIFAAGCFWGVEYYFKRLPGVLKTEVGYTGGHQKNPSYTAVCTGKTGHAESVRVIFDPQRLAYEDLVKYFFEIHDPQQLNYQGPDIGTQYASTIFYYDDKQKQTAISVVMLLKQKGYAVVTQIKPVSAFFRAETDHQDYYERIGKTPYCHRHEKKF